MATFQDATKGDNSKGEITISVDDLLKSRDAIVTGLTTLTSAMNELIRSYIQHTNDMLTHAGVQSSSLAPNVLLDMSMNSLFAPGTEIKLSKKGMMLLGKPKKERKMRDPNAPKRPLTAYFLYSSSARPIVKQDMGPTASAQEVSNEVLRRWTEMPVPEKDGWKKIYEQNADAYRKEVAEYKARTGAQIPEELHDSDVDAEGEVTAAPGAVPSEDSSDDSSDEEVVVAKGKGKAGKKKTAASPSPSAQLDFGGLSKVTPVPLPSGIGASGMIGQGGIGAFGSLPSFGGPASAAEASKKRKKDAEEEEKKNKKPKKDKKEKKEKKDKKKKSKDAGGL